MRPDVFFVYKKNIQIATLAVINSSVKFLFCEIPHQSHGKLGLYSIISGVIFGFLERENQDQGQF